MKTIFLLVSLLLQVIFVPYSFAQTSPLPAFPGAEGYGAMAKGGRGGTVIAVTNLNDTGAGSLRACIEASGPRTCVFKTGGTIVLNSSLDIRNPYITIAGQTAPGGGITLRTSPNNDKGLVVVRNTAHNVIIRYIRVRTGPGGTNGDTLDGITVNGQDVILDHVSISWGIDENMNTWYPETKNVTVQWSIISEGLNNSIHPQGPHSKGFLMGEYNKNISAHHILFAHNMDRHPEMKGDPSFVVEAINNVSYNYGWRTLLVSDVNGVAQANIIGNYFKPGPDSPSYYEIVYYNAIGQGVKLYVKGNIGPHRATDSNKAFQRANEGEWSVVSTNTPDSYLQTTPFTGATIPVAATDAQTAYTQVIAESGNSKSLSCDGVLSARRDSVDERIVTDVKNGTGHIIDHPDQVGGWPALVAGTACPDTDSDGMPDAYETKTTGLNINSADNNGDIDSDGYTNLEEYLNGSVQTGITPSVSPTGQTGCPNKSKGDADCKADGTGKSITITDFEIWRKEYFSQCSAANASATSCQTDDDGIGTLMDANFDTDTSVTIADFEIWRKGYFGI